MKVSTTKQNEHKVIYIELYQYFDGRRGKGRGTDREKGKQRLTHNCISCIIQLSELYYNTNTVGAWDMISFDDFILEDSGPVYLQIIRYIKQGIASGVITDREEVPSRRALSALLGVNPNTIQKAYRMLEEEGILVSRTGAKSYTCTDTEVVERIRRELLISDTREWVRAMKRLGLSAEAARALAEEIWEE